MKKEMKLKEIEFKFEYDDDKGRRRFEIHKVNDYFGDEWLINFVKKYVGEFEDSCLKWIKIDGKKQLMNNVKVQGIKTINNLYCKTGKINAYRRSFLDGTGGSRKDETWNRIKNCHSCCNSKVYWRHKINCKSLKGNKKWQDLEY